MFKNAVYKNLENTVIDIELQHPEYGLIPYTFKKDEEDTSYDAQIREYLKTATISPFIAPIIPLETLKANKIEALKLEFKSHPAVEVAGVFYTGGFESVNKLDAKRRLCIEQNITNITFFDVEDKIVTLTPTQARNVCITCANAYEIRLYTKKQKIKEAENANTKEDLVNVGNLNE